ncbi:MAG: phenylalanine--tRNA ligase subunit beta, partial [Deltaproteobacteria bacterium]|nr:phenylalanine--tRNA ligase subunit beta [Deltaproteobacteria bacterium]
MLISYHWLKEFVDIASSPAHLAESLTMGGFEVESVSTVDGETVFDINVTPNRGDCLSVFGIAREVAAITGCKPKPCHPERPARRWCSGGSEGSHASKGKIKDFISVEVREREKCPRYCARVITGVKIRPSSVEIAGRLTAS